MNARTSKEPINLSEWKSATSSQYGGRLFTCGRPGRGTPGYGRDQKPVDEDTIDRWISGLPAADEVHIVSLLGTKKGGTSEFIYYPFRSSYEGGSKPTFQEWLVSRYGLRFVVHEFRTVDMRGIEKPVLDQVRYCVLALLKDASTVVIVDSAGAERTARVCEHMGFNRGTS